MLKVIAPDRAGEEGWSVAVTVRACARAQMRKGRAAPVLNVSLMIEHLCIDLYSPRDGSSLTSA